MLEAISGKDDSNYAFLRARSAWLENPEVKELKNG